MHTKIVEIRPLQEDEIGFAYEIEKSGYPEDEAASFDTLMYRHQECPELTVGYFENEHMIGFISATRYHGQEVTNESIHMHIPNGESVIIHSVCVTELRRHQGIATKLLRWFTDDVKENHYGVARILLITHSKLIPFYTRARFVFRQKSRVVHGKESWYEFEMPV